MRDKVKRFISILMTALMLVNLMPVGALAEGVTISNSVQGIWESPGYPVFVYVQVEGDTTGLRANKDGWFTIGMIANVKGMPSPSSGSSAYQSSVNGIRPGDIIGNITRFTDNQDINIGDIFWEGKGFKVDIGTSGSYPEYNSGKRWHLDGTIKIQHMPSTYIVRYVDVADGKEIGRGETVTGKMHQTKKVWVEAPDSLKDGLYSFCDDVEGYPQNQVQEVPFTEQDGTLTFYYKKNTYTVNYYLNGTTEKVNPSTTENAKLGNIVFATHDDIDGYTITPESNKVKSTTITKGTNEINFYYYKNVTLTANSRTLRYDGYDHTASGFTVSDFAVPGFAVKPEDITFEGITMPSATGKDAGDYPVNFERDETKLGYPLNKVDTTKKYIVTKAYPGMLTINKRNVTLTSEGGSKTYDGTALEKPDVTVTGDDFADGEVLGIVAQGSVKDVADGEVTNTIFFNKGPNYKDINYIITKNEGTLKINQRKVTLTSGSGEKVYDGKPLTKDEVTVSGEGFVKDEGATYNVTGSQTAEGESKNTFTYTLKDGTKAGNYEITPTEGTLKVTPVTDEVTVTIKGNTASEKYDGTEKTVTGYTVESISNPLYKEGDFTFSGNAVAKGTDADTYDMGLTAGNFTNTSNNFSNVTFVVTDGQLEITKRNVTLTSGSASKVYDGKPLTKDEVTVSGEGFVKDEGATYNVTGSQTAEGESKNTFTYTLKDGTKAGNYEITPTEGTLKVTPVTDTVTVTIKGNTASETYDGTKKTVTGYKVTNISNPLYKEGDFSFSGDDSVSGINAGTYNMELKPEDFTNNNTNFAEVKFVIVDGKLKISKRSVKLTSETASKPYDGTPLTKPEVAVVGDGFVDGEVTDVKATGSVTNVSEGEVTNAITYTEGENFKADNYAIEKDEGKLEISKRNVKLTSASDEKVYDGKPLTNETVAVGGDGFAKDEGATYDFTGSQTDVGESDNEFTFEVNEGTNPKNYTFEVAIGTLKVTPVTDEVIVTITGRTDEMPYDGKEHSVFGYDVTVSNALYNPKEDMQFNGTDVDMTAKGTDAGTYPMKLTAEDFTNKSDNFSKVTFVVTDGYVKINPRAVTLTSETAGKTYDGTVLEKPVVTVGGDGFVEGQVKEIKATGSVTNAGSVANTITFTPDKETFKDGNYAITKTEGTLTIAKRSVLITSQSATKTYDGSALTRPAVTITGDGFVPGELAKAEATGSITNVGSTPNAIQYTTTGAFNAANYSIALSVGTLTVTERPQPEPRRTFNLTISYVYQNGKRAAASYNRGGLKNGETFDITSPVIAGYTASETVVSGTIYNRDIKVTVIYTADGVNLDDYGVPLGLGNITMNVGDCFE